MDMSPVVLYSMTCVMRQVAEKKAAAASYARVQEKALRISGATKLQAQKVSHKCTVKALVNEKKEVIKVMKKAQAECADAQSETTRFRVISIPSRSLPLIRIVSFIRITFAYDHIFCRNSRSTSRD